MKKQLISLLPLFLLLVLLAPIANAQAPEPLCCFTKINLPIDQSIAQYQYTDWFGFTVYGGGVPPTYILLPLTVEYHYNTICLGGVFVIGDAYTSGGPTWYSQVNLYVSKFSLLTGNLVGYIKGLAYGQPTPVVGPPIWMETDNKSFVCRVS